MYSWIIQNNRFISRVIIMSTDPLLPCKITFTGFWDQDVDVLGALTQPTAEGMDWETGKWLR